MLRTASDGGGREIEGGGVDVGEEGAGSAAEDGADGGEEAERRGDNGVAGADPGGGHGQPQRVGAAGASYGMGYGAGFGGGVFEAKDLRAEDELLREADGFDGGEDLRADFFVLPGEIEHRDGLRIAY